MPSPTTPSADLPRPAASTGHPAPASGVGRRVARWLLVALGVVATLLVLLGALLAVIDWNRAKPWVNEKVSEATGRHFAIEGELSAAWHWPQPLEEGWRRWIPGVTVQAERLVMDQPAGFIPPFQRADGKTPPKDNADLPEAPTMARIGSATATVRLLPLLGRHLSIDTVALTSPQVALARTADQYRYEARLLNAVEAVNEAQKGHLFELIQRHYDRGEDEGVRGKTFAVWGLSFKPNTDDMREASSRRLLAELWEAGAQVRAYDPEAREEAARIFGERDDLLLCDDARDAIEGADALVVVTEWKQFRSPDFARLQETLGDAVIFDGRNLCDPAEVEAAGLAYYGIGRGRSLRAG